MGYFTPTGGSSGPASATTLVPTGLDTGTVRSIFQSASAVAASGTATILTYTVPPATTAYLLRIEMGGTNIATYNVLIGATEFARRRTYFGWGVDAVLEVGESILDAYVLTAGQVLTVVVTNFRPTVGDFESRLQVIEAT